MDHVTRQFINYITKLRDELRRAISEMRSDNLDTPREQDEETISPQNHANHECGSSIVDPAIVLKLGPSPEHTNNAQDGWHKTFHWWKDRFEVAAIAAGIFYAIVTFCMWRDAHDNFIVNQRAWVGVDRPIQIESLTGANIKFTVTIKNFGNSVALDVGLHAKAISAWDKMKPASEETCSQAANLSHLHRVKVQTNFGDMPKPLSSGVVFPNDSRGQHFTDVVEKGTVDSPLMVIGCVVYRDQFDKERRTRFCHQSGEGDNALPRLIYQCGIGVNDAD